jgi:hypothetical protein
MQGAQPNGFVIRSDLTRTMPIGFGTAAVGAVAPSMTRSGLQR